MFNDIVLERKDNEDSCALAPRKIKENASKCNDGHWAFLGPGEESKWYQGYATDYGGKWDLRASQMVEDFENSGHPVFQGVSPLGRGILKRRNNRNTIHFNGEYTVHATNQLYIYGAVSKWCGPNSRDASQSKPESARKMSPEIPINGRSQVIGWYSKTTARIGKLNASEFEGFQLDAFMSKIECLRTTAKFHHPIERGIYDVTTTLEDDGWRKRTSMCKEYTAPRNREDSKPYASIDAEKEIGPVFNIKIATIFDVPGIEVHVPSLSSPGYSV